MAIAYWVKLKPYLLPSFSVTLLSTDENLGIQRVKHILIACLIYFKSLRLYFPKGIINFIEIQRKIVYLKCLRDLDFEPTTFGFQ